MSNAPTPKTDAMRAAREARFELVQAQRNAAKAAKDKPVKRSKKTP